jgi:hypothetical protein
MVNRAEIATAFDETMAWLLTRDRVKTGAERPSPERGDALCVVAAVLVLARAVQNGSAEISRITAELIDAFERGRIRVHVNHAEDQP